MKETLNRPAAERIWIPKQNTTMDYSLSQFKLECLLKERVNWERNNLMKLCKSLLSVPFVCSHSLTIRWETDKGLER